MKDEIKTMIKASLVKEFGDVFAPKLLDQVADDRATDLTEKVKLFIQNEALKSISLTKIQKEYLPKKTVNKPLVPAKSDSPSSDSDVKNDAQTPYLDNIGNDLNGKDTSLTSQEVSNA